MSISTDIKDKNEAHQALFQNQIEKRQTLYNMQLHRNRLNDTMRHTKKNYFMDKSYKDMLYDNPKREYLDDRRNDEVHRENAALFSKIAKINDRNKRHSNENGARFGSLNSHVRKVRNQ